MTYRWSGPYLMGTTDREKHVWSYTRDAFGNLTSISVGGALVMKFENDGCGHRLSATDARGRTTRYKHDSRGHVIEQTNPDGTVITQKYHGSQKLVERAIRSLTGEVRIEKWDWSGGDELESMENPEGTTQYQHDADCLLTGIRFSAGSGGGGGVLSGELAYTTDADNRVTSIRGAGGGFSCIFIRYELNVDGKVTKVIDEAGRTTRIEYDAIQREKKRILPNGEIVEREYNAAGWMLRQTETIGGKTFAREWQYDPLWCSSDLRVLVFATEMGIHENGVEVKRP